MSFQVCESISHGFSEAYGFFKCSAPTRTRCFLNWTATGLNLLGCFPGIRRVSGIARVVFFGGLAYYYNEGKRDVKVWTYYSTHVLRGLGEITDNTELARTQAILDLVVTFARKTEIITTDMQLP